MIKGFFFAFVFVAAQLCAVIHAGGTPLPEGKEQRLGIFECIEGTPTFVVFSYLLWKTQMTDSWVTSRITAPNADGIGVSKNDQTMQFHCNSGFKIGVGRNFVKQGWSTLTRWTYIHSSPHRSWHSENHSLINTLARPSTESATYPAKYGDLGANRVEADWRLNFNAIDIELGKNFEISPSVIQRAFVCLRMASVNSKLHVVYSDLVGAGNNGVQGATIWPDQTVEVKNQAWLVGPRMGINESFGIYGDFGIVATVATSIFVATDSPRYTTHVNLPSGGGATGVKTKAPQTLLRPGFDVFLGANWNHCFPNKLYLGTTLGFEAEFFNQAINPVQSLNMFGFTGTMIVYF